MSNVPTIAPCKFGLGYKKDSHPPTQTHRDVLGASLGAALPDTAGSQALISQIGGIRNQSTTQSCVGFAFAQALALWLAGQFNTFYEFSAFFCYWAACAELRKSLGIPATTKLEDDGSQPAMCVKGLGEAGIAFESVVPSTNPATVLQEENLTTSMDAASRLKLTFNAFATLSGVSDDEIVLAMRTQIAKPGGAVLMAISVDQAFEDANGSTVLTVPDLSTYKGGHMISVIAYRPSATTIGEWEFLLLNQWGTTEWGQNSELPGTCWVDESFVLAASQRYIVQASPT